MTGWDGKDEWNGWEWTNEKWAGVEVTRPKNACVEKTYPLYKMLWLTLHFPPLHLHLLISPPLSCQSHDSCRGAANAVLSYHLFMWIAALPISYLHCPPLRGGGGHQKGRLAHHSNNFTLTFFLAIIYVL